MWGLSGLEDRQAVRRLPGSHRRGRWVAVVVAGCVLVAVYLRLSRSVAANADGSSNALQAWDMVHGNVLLNGWTVTDVSFFTTELVQYALLELLFGLTVDVQHIAAAVTFTLLVMLAVAVARGRARGVEALARMGVAGAVILAPAPGHGYETLLTSPNHTGTAVPLLVAWLVLDRTTRGGWRVPLVLWALLTWTQVGDPLALFVGAVPLAVVGGWRLLRDGRPDRRRNAGLLVAAVATVPAAYLVAVALRAMGGYSVHPADARLAGWSSLGFNARLLRDGLAIDFGAYLPDGAGPVDLGMRLLALTAGVAVVVAVLAGGTRFLRRRSDGRGDLVTDVLTVAILANVAAFVFSSVPYDLDSARQIVPVLPLGAALAGRVLGPRLATPRRDPALPPAVPVLAAVLLLLCGGLTVRAVTARPVPPDAGRAAAWLDAQGETYGLGDYWGANISTVYTNGRVHVAPVIAGLDRVYAYRWEEHADWYDPAHHDARFVIVDLAQGGTLAAETHFGTPVDRHDFGRFAVLRYDTNLLVGLPAFCNPGIAENLTGCPDLEPRPPIPGA
jgi:hypothetical protein